MSLLAAAFALVAALVAALGAFADGALLGLDEDDQPADPRVAALLARRERAHRALAFGRIIAQLLAGAATSVALLVSGWVPATLLAPVVVLAGIAVVVVTEVGTRAAGDAAGARGLSAVLPVVEAVEVLFAPVVVFGSWADALLHRILPPPPLDDDDREDAVERFREVVAAEADVEEEGEVLLHGVFSLGDTQVHEIMVPRVDIVGIEQDTPWSQVADRVRSARHARLVVYDGTLDEVVGILYAKDLLPALLREEEPAGGWRSLVRPALFIPSSKSVEKQLREFRSSRRHIAIVVDEFGGTAGLVTLEDALELIVGDIQDEGDVEIPEVERGEGGRLWVAASVTLDVLSDLTGEDVTRGDVTTVGGLVMELLGRVPRAGESLLLGTHRLVVERVVRRRIERVYLEPLAVASVGEDE
ncbi:MAG: hemolysin family protein [Gemmatimonadales bacterium]|nr:HlyC/CorC family transporter [Gemmatimonadota bacterium]MCL4213565.1 hemolysin family protein [Gemmatimonadales bacterium]